MKIFITGVAGQLGYDLAREGLFREMEVYGSDLIETSPLKDIDYRVLDIRDKEAVEKTLNEILPDVVFHCAAWTAVDDAEEDENVEKVYDINYLGTKYIAESCKKIEAKMVYISTDYVFGGQGEEPWKEDSNDFNPQNIYGKSKLKGEMEVSTILDQYFIVRISWVFGKNGNNFVKTMLKVAEKYESVKVVNDQIGLPTYTPDLAKLLADMIQTDKYGFYHVTNEGDYISWYDFTKEIYKQAGLSTEIIPVSTEEYGLSKAERPFNSRLEKEKLSKNGFKKLPTWQDALDRFLIVLGEK